MYKRGEGRIKNYAEEIRNRVLTRMDVSRDLPDECAFLTHSGVDGGEDRVLEWFLVQRWRAVAVFCSVIQTADAAPYHTLFAPLGPGASAVQSPSLAADQPF